VAAVEGRRDVAAETVLFLCRADVTERKTQESEETEEEEFSSSLSFDPLIRSSYFMKLYWEK